MSIAQESGHWYERDGSPAYTVIGKNGKERNTTLRDARKLNLVPSVTTILNVAAKPGLERWRVDQALMAALTLPREEGESLDDFKRRAAVDAREQGIQAAEEGTRIHTAIELSFLGKAYDEAYRASVEAVRDVLDKRFPNEEWSAEKSFCSPLGYGGKVDLHSKNVVMDFKTKDFGPDDKVVAYDEHIMQLDAYRHGLGIKDAVMANLFVSRNNPGVIKLIVHEEGNHFQMFTHLLEFWKLSKGYNPGE